MNTCNEQATYQLRQTVLGTSWDISPCGNRLEFAVAIHCKVMILFDGGSAPQTGPNWAIIQRLAANLLNSREFGASGTRPVWLWRALSCYGVPYLGQNQAGIL